MAGMNRSAAVAGNSPRRRAALFFVRCRQGGKHARWITTVVVVVMIGACATVPSGPPGDVARATTVRAQAYAVGVVDPEAGVQASVSVAADRSAVEEAVVALFGGQVEIEGLERIDHVLVGADLMGDSGGPEVSAVIVGRFPRFFLNLSLRRQGFIRRDLNTWYHLGIGVMVARMNREALELRSIGEVNGTTVSADDRPESESGSDDGSGVSERTSEPSADVVSLAEELARYGEDGGFPVAVFRADAAGGALGTLTVLPPGVEQVAGAVWTIRPDSTSEEDPAGDLSPPYAAVRIRFSDERLARVATVSLRLATIRLETRPGIERAASDIYIYPLPVDWDQVAGLLERAVSQ